jgi:hypothetical protein
MAIDIRATVTCSLGTLISGSISDDYLQGSGLVKTRGTCEISGLITPAIGTAVTFSYTKGGVTRSLPRALRVLSSFADPFRRTTKVELGCKLTYLSDLQEPVVWTAFDDDENNDYDPADQLIVTLPIHANSVMAKCLTELGITASTTPLTNKFSVAEFDFGAGYVQVLSDLLVSESYFGYLDTSEVLQIVSLDQDGGSGPVYTAADIVDLGPIGTGQLPGEAVTVSYSTLKLKNPDSSNDLNDPWVYTITRGAEQSIKVAGTLYSYIPETITETEYESGGERRITKQTVTKTTIAAEAGGSYLETIFNELGYFPIHPSTEITETEVTTYEYAVEAIKVNLPSGGWYYTSGDVNRTTTLVRDSQLRVLASFNLPWAPDGTAYAATTDTIVSRKRVVTEEVVSGYTRTITDNFAIFGYTQEGNQLISTAGQAIETGAGLTSYVATLLSTGALLLDSTDATVNYGDSRLNNRLPPVADINNAANAKGGDPNNGWRTDSVADLELALGSATAQRRIEFSMPYAPDDIFSGPSGGPFTATPSDAPAKANRYGRVQNRLLLGNRSGVNLQLAPERLPVAPFSPLYLQADGLTALYRANGNQWAFDSNGIVCSTDALFWAAVGGTGTFWFPVAPGITTLPAEPAIVDGQMNANTVVLPYNETAIYDSRIGLGTIVTKFDYSLTLLTEVPAAPIKLRTVVQRSIVGTTGSFALSGQDAQLRRPASILRAEAGSFAASDQPARFRPDRLYPADPGVFILSLQPAPISYSGGDPYWNSVKLLLHMNGTNNSTTFTDSGPLALTVTPSTGAVISTAQSKFDGASAYVNGATSAGLSVADNDAWNIGATDFTAEGWIRLNATQDLPIFSQESEPSNYGWEIFIGSTYFAFWCSPDGINTPDFEAPSWNLALDTWAHFAVCRSGNTLRMFKDGTLIQTHTITTNIFNSTAPLLIGKRNSYTSTFTGYLDELRFTRAARYTASFSVQTSAFREGAQTV